MAAVKVEPNNNVSVPKQYGKIVITLENCLLPTEKLKPTPSSLDGLDEETEMDLRILGCELIQTAGILLKLPQVAMATGQVLFQRFFYAKSFVKQNMEVVAMGCVCLASKIEEAPRRIRDVINVFHHIKQVRGGKTIQPMILDQNYINLKNQVIKAERRVLKELGFCVHVKHPHKIIVTFLNQVLDCKRNRQLAQLSWNYMNDSLRTNVFVRYSPEKIACSCIYLSARELKIPLPTKPAWFDIFDVTENEIEDICKAILRLYVRTKPDADKLEKVVDDLKKLQLEAKLKARGILEGTFVSQPNSNQTSRSSSPLKNDKSPLEGEVKKEKGKDEAHSRDGRSNRSPTTSKDTNHVGGQKHSPGSKESRSSKARSRSRSGSTSPSKRKRTPPRSYKDVRKSPTAISSGGNSSAPLARSRSRSPDRGSLGRGDSRKDRKDRGGAHKRKRSKSRSPRRHHHHHHNHKKNSHRDKSTRRRSRSRDVSAGQHEKGAVVSGGSSGSRTSRRDRQRDNGHHRSRSKERAAAPR